MNLLIDAGNTRIKWALVSGGDWLCGGALPTEHAADLPQHLAGRLDKAGAEASDMQIWASNVAGAEAAQHICNISAGRQSARVHFVVAREMQCGVRNGYSSVSQLGSDRWAALIAAWHLTGGNCLVVNSGTATTVDALSATGEFIGGLILPGVELMQRCLRVAAGLLNPAQAQLAQGECVPFPLNTADALMSGAIQASCGAIGRQHALLGDGCAPILLSGGAAKILQAYLDPDTMGRRDNSPDIPGGADPAGGCNRNSVPVCVVDNLVLQGLLLIAQEAGE